MVVKLIELSNLRTMTAFDSLRSQVLALPKGERFKLMFDIQESLPPPPMQDEDDGMGEAMRRWEQDKDNPADWLSHEEFVAAVRSGPAE